MRQKISKEGFVDVWNKCANIDEFLKVTGYTRGSACGRAYFLRSEGYVLKRMYPTTEFYQKIGSKGGKVQVPKGFALNKKLASEAGRKGGKISVKKKLERSL